MVDVRCLAPQVGLVGQAVLRGVVDDPAHFALLMGRRVLPHSRDVFRARFPNDPVWQAVGAYWADDPDRARELLTGCDLSARSFRNMLAGNVAVQVGADTAKPPTAGVLAARAAWEAGRVDDTVNLLVGDHSRFARTVHGELTILTPGWCARTPNLQPRVSPNQPDGGGARVFHVLVNSLPHTRSGYTARTHALLSTSQARDGLTVTGATRPGYPTTVGRVASRDMERVDGVPYQRLLPWTLASYLPARVDQHARLIVRAAAEFGATVIHATTPYQNGLAGLAAAEALQVPFVYEMRGQLELTWVASRPEPLRDQAGRSERVALMRAKETEVAAAADAVIVLSETQRDDLAGRGVPRDKIHVAANGTRLVARSGRTPAQARERLGLSPSGVWFGTVSSLVGYEGLDVFVSAVAAARKQGVDVRACIVGDGVARPGLVRQIRELGVEPVVVTPGRVPPSEARKWVEALDVFVVPRLDTPVCRMVTPLKPVEAMSVGCPVLASDLPALAEIIAGPEAGLLVRAGDVDAWTGAVVRFAGDAGLRERLGANGARFARSRTWDATVDVYQDVYEQVGAFR